MFERNKVDNQDHGSILIEAGLSDGRLLTGRLSIPAGRALMDYLNGANAYIEFEPLQGDRQIMLKSTVISARALAPGKLPNLTQKLRDLDGFDPFHVLGLERGASWEDVRGAYHRLAKTYHADRYATSELPAEVTGYLEGMSRRVNAAYSALEASYAQAKRYAKYRQEPIYTSQAR